MLSKHDTPLERTPLPLRVSNALRLHGILNVGSLLALGRDGAARVPGLGRRSMEALDAFVSDCGFVWSDDGVKADDVDAEISALAARLLDTAAESGKEKKERIRDGLRRLAEQEAPD